MPAMNIAIIGAGMAGVTCARALAEAGLDVTLLEKSRGLGGRLATRRVDGAPAPAAWQFDHGAPAVAAADPAFVAHLRALASARPWRRADQEDADEWVGVPSQSRLVGELPASVTLLTDTRVESLAPTSDGPWRLMTDDGPMRQTFDAVALTAPAPQTAALLPPGPLTKRLAAVVMEPCWALMVATRGPCPMTVSAAGADVERIVADHDKPGRAPLQAGGSGLYVLHATAAWSRRHLEDDRDAVRASLLERFRAAVSAPSDAAAEVLHAAAHRWRYARVARALGEPCLFDAELGLGYAGDGCLGDGAEAAFRSGRALGRRLVVALGSR